jgi:hypothetical protein
MRNPPTPEQLALNRWAETGETPNAHVTVGKLNSLEVKRCVRDAPADALRSPGGVWTDQRSPYVQMACVMELARRGPPSGWRARWNQPRVVGWICYDAKEGWRPLLAGPED